MLAVQTRYKRCAISQRFGKMSVALTRPLSPLLFHIAQLPPHKMFDKTGTPLRFRSPMVPWTVLARQVSVPEELIEKVLKLYKPGDRAGLLALQSCIVVSQQLRRIALPLAYRAVKVYLHTAPSPLSDSNNQETELWERGYSPFIYHFLTYPTIAHTVTSLTLAPKSTLPHFTASACLLARIGSILPRLESLRLDRAVLSVCCTSETCSHQWPTPRRLARLDMQRVRIPPATIHQFAVISVALSVDVLKISMLSVLGNTPEDPARAVIALAEPLTLSVSALQLYPATREALRQLTEVTMSGITSIQLGEVDWKGFRLVDSILRESHTTLNTLALHMGSVDDVGVYGEHMTALLRM